MIIIAQIIFALSILGILYFILRRIPDLLEYPRHSSEAVPVREGFVKKWQEIKEKAASSEFLHNVVIPRTEKLLRKIKIVVLKFDNFLARRVEKLRERMRRRRVK